MTQTLLKIIDGAGAGKFVKTYDPDANDGRGLLVGTFDPDEAIRFDGAVAALEFWRQQSTVRPLRPDGKPNRPLTAATVALVTWPTGAAP